MTVILWETAYRLGVLSAATFPPPTDVGRSLLLGLSDGSLAVNVAASMKRIAFGYTLSIVMGLPLGVFLSRFEWARQTLGQLVLGLQTLPSICWLPLAVLWFGTGETAIQFVVVSGSVFAVIAAVASGLQTVPPTLVAAGRTLGARGLALYTRVMLPAALPTILGGLKLGWSFAWRGLMAGELIIKGAGLGHVLQEGRNLGDMGRIVAAMIVILAIGLLVENLLFRPAESRLHRRWGLAAAS